MKKLLCCLMAAVMLLGCVGALAENATLTVQGMGIVYVDADCATICVGVRELGQEVADVQSAVNARINAVIAAMGEMGIAEERISTNAISIYPNYDYSEELERIVGYTGYNSILVQTDDIDNVGNYIDAAFIAGANSLDYVEFTASDTAEASAQALKLAVASAREKAEVLAEAAGMTLGGILEMREGSDGYLDSDVTYAKAEDAGFGTRVLASRQRVDAAIKVTFELNEKE